MESLTEGYLELMRQKLEILGRMRDITKNEVFTGESRAAQEEAAAFKSLQGRRAAIIKEIHEIDKKMEGLEPLGRLDLEDKGFRSQVLGFRHKMTLLAKEMLEMDKANAKAYKKLAEHLKGDICSSYKGGC